MAASAAAQSAVAQAPAAAPTAARVAAQSGSQPKASGHAGPQHKAARPGKPATSPGRQWLHRQWVHLAHRYKATPCNAAPKRSKKASPRKLTARCFSFVRTNALGQIVAQPNQPPAGALGPADIQSAYKLPANAGGGQTVAVVDAGDDPNAESDLAVFRSQYGLPPCTTANGCFRKVNQTGGTSSYPPNAGWGIEISLDLDAVSSACPNCHILLVEANSPSLDDLGTAVDTAVSLGAKYVSNSYGVGGEFSGETGYDHYYDHTGVAVTASTGDSGYRISWPASNPDLTAVGGTTLTKDTSVPRGWNETAWSGSGSGCSQYEAQPAFQQDIAQLDAVCKMRANADISADADPNSGLAVYDSFDTGGWLQVGGTSLSSPLVAAMYALAGPPAAGTYPVSYPYDPTKSGDLFDVTQGSNGGCGNVLCTAGAGWDGPTGLGTPDGVDALTTGPHGDIAGKVTDQSGNPVAGVAISTSSGYQTTTDASGNYDLHVLAGTYDVTASKYGYLPVAKTGVQVTQNQTTTVSFTLATAPTEQVQGTVTTGGGTPVANATVTIGDTPLPPATTDASGNYSFAAVPEGSYQVTVASGQCFTPKTVSLVVSGPTTLNVTLEARHDGYGYTCRVVTPDYVQTTTAVTAGSAIKLPFTFPLYGAGYTSARLALDGYLQLLGDYLPSTSCINNPSADSNTLLPSPDLPNAVIAPFWDNLQAASDTWLGTETLGTPGDQQFVIEWRNVKLNSNCQGTVPSTAEFSFEVVLAQDGSITFQYADIPAKDTGPQGGSASVGLENGTGSDAFAYSINNSVLSNGQAVKFTPPPSGQVTGTITDNNDGQPVAGAVITATSSSGTTATVTTGSDGTYLFDLPYGPWTITAAKDHYTTAASPVTTASTAVQANFALHTAAATVSSSPIQVSVPLGGSSTATIHLASTGDTALNWAAGAAAAQAGSPGTVLSSFTDPEFPGTIIANGIAVTGKTLWLSNRGCAIGFCGAGPVFKEYQPTSQPTGRLVKPSGVSGIPATWPENITYDPTRGVICALVPNLETTPASTSVSCWDPATGQQAVKFTGSPWGTTLTAGAIAYDPSNDTFYLGGTGAFGVGDGVIYHVAGASHANPGAVLGECLPANPDIAGLAYNTNMNVLYAMTNAATDTTNPGTITELDPTDCSTLGTIAGNPDWQNGISLDANGNLWADSDYGDPTRTSTFADGAQLLATDVPAFSNIPWLHLSATSGNLAPGASGQITVTVDASHLDAGSYTARIGLSDNAGRASRVTIPVTVTVKAPPNTLAGTVTDANDGKPVAGATVTATSGTASWSATTGSDGTYSRPLPAGTWTVTTTAANYTTSTGQVTISSSSPATVPWNVALRTAVATPTPATPSVTLPFGGKVFGGAGSVNLSLANTGTAGLTWQLLSQSGTTSPANTTSSAGDTASPTAASAAKPRPGTLRWLQPPARAVTALANPGTSTTSARPAAASPGTAKPAKTQPVKTTAYPSAAQWTPDTATPGQPRILVYTDNGANPAPGTPQDQALQHLGLAYTAYYNDNFTQFEDALQQGGWDIVIFADETFFPPSSVLDALNSYVQGGGRLAASSWVFGPYGIGTVTQLPIWQNLGVALPGGTYSGGMWNASPVYYWQPQSPAFTTPEKLPPLDHPEQSYYAGTALDVLTGFHALAGWSRTPVTGLATMVAGNNDRTIYSSVTDYQYTAGDDTELWEDFVHNVQDSFASVPSWLKPSATSGSIAPGAAQQLTLSVDDTGLDPGTHTARLLLATNAGRTSQVTIPVTVTVSPPPGTLAGTVEDSYHHNPVPFTTVTATAVTPKAAAGTTFTATADPTGHYSRGLPAGTWDVTYTGRNFTQTKKKIKVTSGSGEIWEPVVLDTSAATAGPDSISATLPAGTKQQVPLSISDAGAATLSWQLLERADEPATYPAAATTTGSKQRAMPAGKTAGTTATTPRILVYVNNSYHPHPNSWPEQALRALGLPYTVDYTYDLQDFLYNLASRQWDLVIMDDSVDYCSMWLQQLNSSVLSDSKCWDALGNYVNSGGRLIFATNYNFQSTTVDNFLATLGVSNSNVNLGNPLPIYRWVPNDLVFTHPNKVPPFEENPISDINLNYGNILSWVPGATALSGWQCFSSASPDICKTTTPGDAASVLANHGRTIIQGFMDDDFKNTDLNKNGVTDGVELWENYIYGVLPGYGYGFTSDVPWLSESATSGTLAPGTSTHGLSVTVDASNLSPGTYTAELAVETNSAVEPEVNVPVKITVTAPATSSGTALRPQRRSRNPETAGGTSKAVTEPRASRTTPR